MNIALIIEHFDKTRGAAEHMAVWLANQLAARGHTVHVVCHDVSARINRYRQATLRASHDADQSHQAHPPTSIDPPSEPMITSGAIKIHRLKGMHVNTGFGFRRFGRRARRWCAAHDIDVVHSLTVAYPGDIYHACAGVYAAMQSQALESAPQKTAAWKRVMNGLTGKERSVLALERRALQRTAPSAPARIISLCRMMTDQFQKFYGVDGKKIAQLPSPRLDLNGASAWTPERTQEERAWFRGHYRLAPSDRVALFVGHNFRRKGLRYAIEAIAKTQSNWKLLVVGLGKAKEYIELADRLGIGDAGDSQNARVLFVGPTREMDRVYSAADVLLLPTFYDSFGLVVMEAFAHGLPVVTTEFLGASELVREYEAGTIVPSPRAVDEIAAALDALPKPGDPAAALLAQRARAAGAGISPDAFIDSLLALYADVQKE